MKTLIAVPTRGAVHWRTITRLDEIREKYPVDRVLYQECKYGPALARNAIVQKFLKGDHEVLAIIDDDVVPPLNFLDRVDYLDEYGVLGIPYPVIFNPFIELAVFQYTEGKGFSFLPMEEGLHECDAIGGGGMLIHRRVFDEVGEAPFYMSADPRDLRSEEFVFCLKAKEAGFKIGYYWDYENQSDHLSYSTPLIPLREAMVMLSMGMKPEVKEDAK